MQITQPLHHAYYLSGNRERLKKELLIFVEKDLGVKTQGNPDFLDLKFETLAIDEARKIQEMLNTKAISSFRTIFISFFAITTEAQNALLKLLEEPGKNNHFFLIGPSPSNLLPTLLSRLISIKTEKEEDMISGKKFLEASTEERLKMVEKIAASPEKKEKMISLIESLETYFSGKVNKGNSKVVEEILTFKNYLFDRAPSVKMIGEYIAIRLPKKD